MIYRLLDTMTAYQMAELMHDCYFDPDFHGEVQFMGQPWNQIGMYIKAEIPTDVYLKWCGYLKMEK